MGSKRTRKDRADRVPLQILINYEVDHKKVTMFCTNLSTSGLFVETLDLVPKGSKLKVSFTLPMEKNSFSINANVVWHKKADASGPEGMGLEFEQLDHETAALLDRALTYFKKIMRGAS